MTQGLQFSVLFSSVDNTLSIDATSAAVADQSPELQQQAARFQQLLNNEQVDGARRQLVAAAPIKPETATTNPADPVILERVSQQNTHRANVGAISDDALLNGDSADLANDENDAAGDLLVLIQRANLTSGQLQKKTEGSNEFRQLVPESQVDKAEPIEQKTSAVTPGLLDQNITPVPSPELITDNDFVGEGDKKESAATQVRQLQQGMIVFTNTMVPEQGLTPVPGPEDNAVIQADYKMILKTTDTQKALGYVERHFSPPTNQTELAESGQTKFVESDTESVLVKSTYGKNTANQIPQGAVSAQPALLQSDVDNVKAEQGKAAQLVIDSDAMSNVQPTDKHVLSNQRSVSDKMVSQSQNQFQLSANDKQASSASEASVTVSETVESSESTPNQPIKADLRQTITANQANYTQGKFEIDAAHKSAAETGAPILAVHDQITSDQNELARQLLSTAPESTESSFKPSLLSANRVVDELVSKKDGDSNGSSGPSTAARTLLQSDASTQPSISVAENKANVLDSQSSKQSSVPQGNGATGRESVSSESGLKETTEQRGTELGTEQRLLQSARMDVVLANTATGQTQPYTESAQQQLARYEAAVSSSVQLQRTAEKASTPELSTRLKQLSLQQHDAAGQLRERVQLMVRQNIQVAEIRLDPAELGQMQIRINLQQEQASVQFIVQQQHAKELLEQQMPRLREMLQQQGIQLGEGQVQQQTRQQQGQGDANQRQASGADSSNELSADDGTELKTLEVRQRDRLVDYYA